MAVRVKDRIEANIRQSDKVNNSLSIQLNSGTATVYNGSAAKSINVTPAAIGAPSTDGTGASGTWNITSASTQRLLSPDTRSTSIIPTETLTGLVADFKAKGTVGITASGNYVGVLTWRSYSTAADLTGGQPIQIAYTQDNELQTRLGNTSTWGSWVKLLNSSNYTSYTVTKTGSGASGTWGISISGNAATATKATQDASGNIITSSYLRRYEWWASGNGNDVDTLRYGTTFAYTNHNAPTVGTIVAFDCSTNTNYTLQLMGSYNGNALYYRNRNGDTNTWLSWLRLLDSNNYSNYALPLTGGTLSGRLYMGSDWIYFNTENGLYWPNHYSLHIIPNQVSTYCGARIRGDKGGYHGILCGDSNIHMNVMSSDEHQGLYNESNGRWIIYYNKPNNVIALGGASITGYTVTVNGSLYASGGVYGAVWNDYADFRQTVADILPGEVVIEQGDGSMKKSHKRLQPGANIVTDTYGFAIGETDTCKTPIAVAGRVLAYPYEDRYLYKAGDAVCSAPDGKVSKMTREEMVMYPDCIIGYVSEIPEYEVWGQTDIPVNRRIWIKV